ncbi:hypothetical protein BsWGS_26466 [Bradybaena similaris]
MDDNARLPSDVSSSQQGMDIQKERRVPTKKTNKPLIEKRRRARINECLQQLKEIIVKDRQLDNARGNRLEKADILEMTVEYIRQLSQEGSPGSCLQSAYERGVERCVREMSEFMVSQRDVMDSSVTHKLTSHCRKMLGHHFPPAEDGKCQLSASKRTVPIATATMADSSTSPKRYRLDDDNESNIDISGGGQLVDGDSRSFVETPKAEIINSPQSLSPIPVALQSNSMASSFIKQPEIETASPNSSLRNSSLTVQSEPVGSSHAQFSNEDCLGHVLSASCIDSVNPANSSNRQTEASSHSISTGLEKQIMPFSITPCINPPLPNFISKPVFFSCPSNIFILVDKPVVSPQPVLQNPLPGSVFPVDQSTLTLLPTALTYKLPTSLAYTAVENTHTEIGLQGPSISGSTGPSSCLPSMLPQHNTTVSQVTSQPGNPVSVLLNPAILVKQEPGNNPLLSLGYSPTYQFQFHSQDNLSRVFHNSTQSGSHFQNNSGQVSPNVQANNSQVPQNVQQVSKATEQHRRAEQMLQENSPPCAHTAPKVTHAPAGFTFSSDNNGPFIPEVKLQTDKISENKLPEYRQPEYRLLENTLPENKQSKQNLPDHNVADNKLPENKQTGNRLFQYGLPEAVSPIDHKRPPTISQASQLPDALKDSSSVHSFNVRGSCPRGFKELPTNLRLAPADDSCILLLTDSRLAAPMENVPSSNETFHSALSCDESSNVLKASSSILLGTPTDKLTRAQHSTRQNDNHTSDSPTESSVVYKSSSCMTRAVSRVLISSSSDAHELFSHLPEPGEVLDLSYKVEVNANCRNERSDVDINNNALRSTDLFGGRSRSPSSHSLGVNISDDTNIKGGICNLTFTRPLLNQGFTHKETVCTPCTRLFPGLDQNSVWRPWGNNPELKELH